MTDDKTRRPQPPTTSTIASPEIDVQQGGLGKGPGYSGQEYDADDFAIDRALAKSAEGKGAAPVEPDDRFPPDNGRRAFFDQRTGEVHGSGAGAGGGNPGEDFASDPAAGDGFPQTGRGSVPRGSSRG
jgi:hypothetical protein